MTQLPRLSRADVRALGAARATAGQVCMGRPGGRLRVLAHRTCPEPDRRAAPWALHWRARLIQEPATRLTVPYTIF